MDDWLLSFQIDLEKQLWELQKIEGLLVFMKKSDHALVNVKEMNFPRGL